MAQTTYCNTSTDLVGAYSRIEASRDLRILKGYVQHASAVYKIGKVGSFEAMYEDNLPMTLETSANAINQALEYYYDSTNDILYFYFQSGKTYRIGEDWASTKTRAVQDASRDAEAILNVKYTVPLWMSPDGTSAAPYDRDLTKAVAKMACAHILSRLQPMEYDNLGNPQNTSAHLYEEGRRALQEYVNGKRVFSWEISPAEVGKYNIRPATGNTSVGIIQLRGTYSQDTSRTSSAVFPSGSTFTSYLVQDPFWVVKIISGGALGTATFSVSLDNGTTYSGATVTTSNQWLLISSGIWIRFLARAGSSSDFITNDTWQIELYGPDREVTNPGIRSIPIEVI